MGPAGFGPRTGRAAGYCVGYDMPGYMNPGPGRGLGMGFGGGRGGWRHRHWFYATGVPGWARLGNASMWATPPAYAEPTREQELDALKQQAEWLKGQLDAIHKRVAQLEDQ